MTELNLNPPPMITTEREDLIAAFHWWVDKYYNDLVFKYHRSDMKEFEKEYLESDNAVLNLEDLETKLKDMRNESHMGDCVKVACTCGRCFAESFYKVPSTVNWVWRDGRKVLKED